MSTTLPLKVTKSRDCCNPCCVNWGQTMAIADAFCTGVADTHCGKQAHREERRDQPRLGAGEPEEIIPPQRVRVWLRGGTCGARVCLAPSGIGVSTATQQQWRCVRCAVVFSPVGVVFPPVLTSELFSSPSPPFFSLVLSVAWACLV